MFASLESDSSFPSSFPGSLPDDAANQLEPRSHQRKLLKSWLFPVPCPCAVWCWGGIGTGKTHLLKEMLQDASGRGKVALVDCALVMTANRSAKTLFESVLNQLSGHDVNSQNSFGPKWSCPNTSSFLQRLEELAKESPCFIVFDNADALVDGVDAQVFSFLVEMPQDLSGSAAVLFAARKDWRLCARGFSLGAHPLQLHFPSWTEEESKLILKKMALSSVERRNSFKKANREARGRWTSRLVQTLHTSTAPLFGMHNLHVMELDGFQVHQSPLKEARVKIGRLEEEQTKAADQYLQNVYAQDAEQLMMRDDNVGVEVSTPARGQSLLVPLSVESSSKRERTEQRLQEARSKRLHVLSLGTQQTMSLPRFEAALVIAAFCASIVPKSMDSQVFSDVHSRKKQNKSKATVGAGKPTAAQQLQQQQPRKSKSFTLERLLMIFKHVIGNKDFVPSPFWFNSVESVVNAGFLHKRVGKVKAAKFTCETPIAQVRRLALEIDYRHIDDVLAAQI